MSRFLSSRFAALSAYTPGEQPQDKQYVKLNTNESPYPPCEATIAAVHAAAQGLNLYPDPTARVLREKLAARYGVQMQQVFVSNGSDDILNFAFMAFCDAARPVAFPDVSYGFYPVYAALYGLPATQVPLTPDFRVEVNDYADVAHGGMVVIANPNAPTGLAFGLQEIETLLLQDENRVVVIDEAYVDFGGQSCLPLLARYENLLIVRTFSKSRSMAGARLGFAFGSAALIEDLEKMRYSTNPYSINAMTLAAGAAALDNDAYDMENCKRVMNTRQETAQALRQRGFVLTDSMANFLFAKPPRGTGGAYYLGLKARGVLVRHFNGVRTRDYVRISIGTPAQMQTLLAATDAYLETV